MHQSANTQERRDAWRAAIVFLLFTFALSAVFLTLAAKQGALNLLLVTGVMWSPGIAAVLTCIYLKRSISTMPWSWGQWRWNWYAWLLPIGYGLVMYLAVWVFELGGSQFGNPETLASWTSQITGSTEISLPAVLLFIFLIGTVGIVGTASRALGEEIGWRGFLIWELRKVMPFWAVGVMSGLIWSIWHWPGIIYAYFSFRSNSLWPALLLHASHNLFIQQVFTPLTIRGNGTHFYIDEFGILLPIVSCIVALYFYRRARAEGL